MGVIFRGAFIVHSVGEICRRAGKEGSYPILSLGLGLASSSLCSPFSRDYSHIVLVAARGGGGGEAVVTAAMERRGGN